MSSLHESLVSGDDDEALTPRSFDCVSINCTESEDNIILVNGSSFDCLSVEDVDTIEPPCGRTIEDQKNVIKHLRKLAESSPKVYENIMNNAKMFDQQLEMILQKSSHSSQEKREQGSVVAANCSDVREQPSVDDASTTDAVRALISNSKDEIAKFPSITVVD